MRKVFGTILVSLVICSSGFANELSWKCEATCFRKTKTDFSRDIVSSYGANQELAFSEILSQCKINSTSQTFLRDYVYRGGIPVVGTERNDYFIAKNKETNPKTKHFCKNLKAKEDTVAKLNSTKENGV